MRNVHAGMGSDPGISMRWCRISARRSTSFKVPAREQKELVAILAPMKKDIVTR